jgi:chromosome partitioning protein
MRIIAIANQKGGCGKTTTAINLSSSLSLKEQKVLLIDLDPQSHATMGLSVNSDHGKTMYDVMMPGQSEHVGIQDIVVSIKDNFDVAPSNITLSAIEQEFAGMDGRENRLLRALQALNQQYDHIIIDCPPSIGHLCFNALRACEEVIIPIDMSLFSLRGVAKLTDIILLLKDRCDHLIRSRALVTMYDRRTRYSRRVLKKVKEQFGDNVFDTVIRYNIRLRETVDYGLPVGDYDKHAIGHKDYARLAEEVMGSEVVTMDQAYNASSAAHDMLRKTEDYINAVAETPVVEELTREPEGVFADALKSSYSAMVEAISTNVSDSISEDEEEIKEYQ